MYCKQIRKCVACGHRKSQLDMIRIARVNNEYVIDKTFKIGGRGAYICGDFNCVSVTIRKKLLNKSFKTNVNNEIYEKLGEYEQNN